IILLLEAAQTIAIVSILRELRQVQRTHLLARRIVGVEVPLVLLQVAGRIVSESIALVLPIRIVVWEGCVSAVCMSTLNFSAPAKPERHVALLIIVIHVRIRAVARAPLLTINP